jgi:flagellar basal body rod protein FlgG
MPYGLYISAEGAHAQSKRLEVLANNLANSDTTGFKRDLAVLQARFAETTARGLDQSGTGSINDLGGGVEVAATKTDFSPGPIKQTGIKSDLAAVDPDTFFVVQKGDQQMLTRAGNFSVNGLGLLVNQSGFPVMSDSNTPIEIAPVEEGGPWQMTADGGVQQAGAVTYLSLVRPQSLGDLVKVGENLFKPLSEPVAIPPEERRVLSGHLEGSGVKPTLEMMDLIESSRGFEANVNLIKHQDQMFGTLISRLLKE